MRAEDLLLFGSHIWFNVAMTILYITLVISDTEKEGRIAFVGISIYLGLNFYFGNVPILELLTWRGVGCYLLLGFIFSLVRTFFKGRELDKTDKKYFDLKDHVLRWILMFPICLTNWLFSDLIGDFFNFIYKFLGKIYEKLFNL